MADALCQADEGAKNSGNASLDESRSESTSITANDGNGQERANAIDATLPSSTASCTKQEVCRKFLSNRCHLGNSCKYRHIDPELRARSRSPLKSEVVCRDFLHNHCTRGDRCRFSHPSKEEEEKGPKKNPWFTLCLDYQKGKCDRSECRFFHIRRDDEEHFYQTGEISHHVIEQALRKSVPMDIVIRGIPACKDYQKSSCRLNNCRFRHLNRREYEDEVYFALQNEFKNLLGEPRLSRRGADSLDRDPSMPYKEEFMRSASRERYGRPYELDSHGSYSLGGPPRHRVMHPDDVDRLRKDFQLLQRDYYDLKALKEKEIASLKQKIDDMALNRGSVSPSTLESLAASNEGFIKDNRQLLENVHRLQKENDELKQATMRGLSGELQMKLTSSESEVKSLKEELFASQNQLSKVKEEFERFKAHQAKEIQDLVRTTLDDLNKMQNELNNWRGPLPPNMNDWVRRLKSLFDQISKLGPPQPQPFFNSGSSNLASEMNLEMASHY